MYENKRGCPQYDHNENPKLEFISINRHNSKFYFKKFGLGTNIMKT